MKKKFIIIDGNNLAYRAFYALPMLTNSKKTPIGAIFGFIKMLILTIKEYKPDYIAVAFDFKKKNFRHTFFEDYKATRKPTPEQLKIQIPLIKQLLSDMGIKVVEQDNIEADDIIGSLCNKFNTENYIVSADKDVFQLINEKTRVVFPKKGISETTLFTMDNLQQFMGITASQVIDLKSLMGDSSDNIPGAVGVGEKTAMSLLSEFGTKNNIYANIDKIGGKLKDKLIESKDMVDLSYKLATIITNANLPYVLDDFKYEFPFSIDVYKLFSKFEFKSILKQSDIFSFSPDELLKNNDNKTKTIKITTISELEKLNKSLNKKIYVVFNSELFSVFTNNVEYVLYFKKDLIEQYLDFETSLPIIKSILENKTTEKVVYDFKSMQHVLDKFNIKLQNVCDDVLLSRYLSNSNAKSNSKLVDIFAENELINNHQAYNLYVLNEKFLNKLKEDNLLKLYYEIEIPLMHVLLDMERTGFKIDANELQKLEIKYDAILKDLTRKIIESAGVEFNINSPKQLGNVLFDVLKLKVNNNKKQSTNVNVLNKLVGQHVVIDYIIQYRLINKLYSTYIMSFKELINKKTSKIHCNFNQTVTSTGRLSSSEPNLQNIPTRSDEGKILRKMFVSSFENGVLVSADYNQIELRLLASFSGDEQLIESYNNNIDIHTKTASEIFHIPFDEVDKNHRHMAKAINFGIIYGISDYGLSKNIGISVSQANEYIKKYFKKYPRIENYMKSNIEFCKIHGYVETIFKRRRYIPEIHSPNAQIRMFGERASMNMPLQGSAGDIIKLAMIKVYNKFNELKLKSKLILQIHDELIVDTHPNEIKQVSDIIKDCMENCVSLPVKLVVGVDMGSNLSNLEQSPFYNIDNF